VHWFGLAGLGHARLACVVPTVNPPVQLPMPVERCICMCLWLLRFNQFADLFHIFWDLNNAYCKSCRSSIVHSNCFFPYKSGFLMVFVLFVSVKHIVMFGISFKILEHVVY
jgi:hypothetical protein